jgi:NodT family efflux transporter outer membrane factor (OMF) lipoprotein
MVFKRLLLTGLVSLIAGCAVGPDFKTPDSPKLTRYTDKPLPDQMATVPNVPGGTSQSFEHDADIPDQWWKLYKSSDLDKLVELALKQNPTLGAADAALRSAQLTATGQVGALFPSIGLNASGTRQQVPPSALGLSSGPSRTYDIFGANASVSYRLDTFGGIRRGIESARALAEFQQFQVEGAYLTLTTNIVTTAVREAALRDQYKATEEILKAQTSLATLIEKQFSIGSVSKIDVDSQNSLVANSQIDLLFYDKNIAVAKNMLAVYTGNFPGSSNVPEFQLTSLSLPSKIPVSVPSNLVRQRPDIRAAEAMLKSTNALVGVATANLLPQITLTGATGSQALTTGALFGPGAALWSVAGGVFQPLFQGGQLIAQRQASVANYEQAVFKYQATVLNAFQEVANALRAVDISARTLKAASDSERYSYDALRLVEQQYELGTGSYFSVLVAQNKYQAAKRNLIQAQADRFTDTAILFAALGGGWWNREGPAFQPVQPATK